MNGDTRATAYPELLEVLEVVALGSDLFTAPAPPATTNRLFGGQVAAQTLRAAAHTVPGGRQPHSLHGYFLRPGQPGVPLLLHVQRVRDGRSFTTRRVTAEQGGAPIFTMSASFHVGEPGENWQPTFEVRGPPEASPAGVSVLAGSVLTERVEIRVGSGAEDGRGAPLHPLWLRTKNTLPDDPAVHAAVVTFLSDFGLAVSARYRYEDPDSYATASLDHAVWFHRMVRADDWLVLSVGQRRPLPGARHPAFGPGNPCRLDHPGGTRPPTGDR